MRLVTFSAGPAGDARAGVRVGHRVLDIEAASRVKGEPLPSSVRGLLAAGRGALSRVRALAKAAATEAGSFSHAMHEERAVRLLAPVPDALLVRDAPAAPHGGAAIVFVVGRQARGIASDEALDHVAGITLLLDLPGGPVVGPEIVTADEIGDPGDLSIAWSVNGALRARSNAVAAFDRFPALLEQSTRENAAEPGDLFAAAIPVLPAAAAEWPAARPGDVFECAIEGVATLRATINGS